MLSAIQIEWFKSIRDLYLPLRPVNVLIGANGAGKSNLLGFFRLLQALRLGGLKQYVADEGSVRGLLWRGRDLGGRRDIYGKLAFSDAPAEDYSITLQALKTDDIIVSEEAINYLDAVKRPQHSSAKRWHAESSLDEWPDIEARSQAGWIWQEMKPWCVYHFHPTSSTSPVRRKAALDDNRCLKSDGENLAAVLYLLRQMQPEAYQAIRDTVRMVAAPFFYDFDLEPDRLNPREIALRWRQAGSDDYFDAHQLSDGTLRFICLATLLLSNQLPSLVLLDEPELGLHPYAVNVLGGMLLSASAQTQLIISTQSVQLLDEFEPADIVVVEQHDGESVFKRQSADELGEWLEDYTLGELWEKNRIGGRPTS